MSYWTSPRGILQRACDKANPYKLPPARVMFRRGWDDAADSPERVQGQNAYAKGWNARRQYEEGLA